MNLTLHQKHLQHYIELTGLVPGAAAWHEDCKDLAMSTAYQMNLCINVPGKRRNEALSLLRPLVQTTRVLPECLSCVLYQDEENSGSLCLIEEWIAEPPMMQHVQSEAFRMIFAAMELSVDTPDLRFRTFQDMGGLDMVEEVRQG